MGKCGKVSRGLHTGVIIVSVGGSGYSMFLGRNNQSIYVQKEVKCL